MTLHFSMAEDSVYFAALGGCGHFGANVTLYGHQDKWIMIDFGMGFAGDRYPGVDITLPDISSLDTIKDDILGVFITHGHDDHIGAIEYLWHRLRLPIYATAFTAGRIRQSIANQSWADQVKIIVVEPGMAINVAPFTIDYIPVAHSIPEACALHVDVPPVGSLLHTGDWKIDDNPVIGHKTNGDLLKKIGDKGVLSLICDSTNAMVAGHSLSETDVQKCLIGLFKKFSKKIIVTCFATNLARLYSIYTAAAGCGRSVCLVGRSLWGVDDVARRVGYLKGIPPFLDIEQAQSMPQEKVIYVCTGSQGERRSALARVAAGEHSSISLEEGDAVIFSSRVIPGNEPAVDHIKNMIYAMKGVHVVTDHDEKHVHASGHPYRDELKKMYSWVRPKSAIPVHGGFMQLEAHAALAKESGVDDVFVPENGQVIKISRQGLQLVNQFDVAMQVFDGRRIIPAAHASIADRRHAFYNGSAVVTIVVDCDGELLSNPQATAFGVIDPKQDIDILSGLCENIQVKIKNMPRELRRSDTDLREAVRISVRRFLENAFDKKPRVHVHLVRI